MCAAEGDYEKVVQLLLEFKAEKDCRDKKGWTALMYASCAGNVHATEMMLRLDMINVQFEI